MSEQSFLTWLQNKNEWSLRTFGSGQRAEGVLRHIESELEEIRETPDDLFEWVDVILLALDGAFRSGHSAEQVLDGIYEKQKINTERTWNIPQPDEQSFHRGD